MEISVLAMLKMILLYLILVAGIIFFVLVLLLILPVSYHLKTSLKEQILLAEGKVRWLGPVFMLDFSYNEQFNYSFHILGFRCNCRKSEKENKANNNGKEIRSASAKKHRTDGVSGTTDNKESENGTKEEKKSHWKERLSAYYVIWNKEETQITFQRAKIRIGKLLQAILPTRWLIEGVVGFSDPSLTGNLMGALGAAFPILGNHVKIIPDFQEEKILIKGWAKGRVSLGTLIYHIAVFFLNKHCFQFLKMFLGIEEDKIKSVKQEA